MFILAEMSNRSLVSGAEFVSIPGHGPASVISRQALTGSERFPFINEHWFNYVQW